MNGIKCVAEYTVKEIVNEKVFLISTLFSFFLIGFVFFATKLTPLETPRVFFDLGRIAISGALFFFVVYFAPLIVKNDHENRIVYLFLSRPISRWEYQLGRILGFAFALLIFQIVISIAMLVFMVVVGSNVHIGLLVYFGFNFIKFLTLGVLGLLIAQWLGFFSCMIIMVGVFILGVNVDYLYQIANADSNASNLVLYYLSWFIPKFSIFSIASFATYGLPMPIHEFFGRLIYGILLFSILSVGAVVSFWKKVL